MKHSIKAVIVAVGMLMLSGCGDSNIEIVKTGIMEQYPQGTIGDVFQNAFDGGSWEGSERNGKHYVTFTAKIPQALHDKYLALHPHYKSWKKAKDLSFIESTLEFLTNKKAPTPFMKKYMNVTQQTEYAESRAELMKVENDYATNKSKLTDTENLLNRLERKKEVDFYEEDGKWKKRDKPRSAEDLKQMSDYKKMIASLKEKVTSLKAQERLVRKKAITLRAIAEPKANELDPVYFDKYVEAFIWPVDTTVSIEFLVYPSKKEFELNSFSNDGWGQEQIGLSTVLKTIYTN